MTFLFRLSETGADLGFHATGDRGGGKIVFLWKLESKKEGKKFIEIPSHLNKKFTNKLTRTEREKFFLTILLTFEWAPLK